MGTKTLKIHANKEDFPSSVSVEKVLKLIRKMWVDYVKGLLKVTQSTVESSSELLTEEELDKISSESSFECDAFKWKWSVQDEPTCITGYLKISCPKYTPEIIGNNWGSPSKYPWIKFSETFSDK
jgi:hypothetical protein